MTTTLKIRPVLHVKGDANRFCGPSAISSLTGMNTGEAARLLRACSPGRKAITGVTHALMFRALGRCGILPKSRKEYALMRSRPTLAAWLTSTHGERGGRVFLISAGRHFQLVSGNRYVCGRTEQIVGFDAPLVQRRAKVWKVWELEAAGGTRIPAEARKPKVVRAPAGEQAKAKRLAATWGVEIERHTDLDSRPWFVSHPDLIDTPADPHDGDHYVHSWGEVLERVETYARALQARAVAA